MAVESGPLSLGTRSALAATTAQTLLPVIWLMFHIKHKDVAAHDISCLIGIGNLYYGDGWPQNPHQLILETNDDLPLTDLVRYRNIPE